jgi:hypothetical protein
MKVAATDETKAFFSKMMGDYCRYVAECTEGSTLDDAKNGALKNYKISMT